MNKPKDFLDEVIKERTKKNPDFPKMVKQTQVAFARAKIDDLFSQLFSAMEDYALLKYNQQGFKNRYNFDIKAALKSWVMEYLKYLVGRARYVASNKTK